MKSQCRLRVFVSLLYCSGKKAGDQRPPNLKITPTPHARSCFNVDGLENSQRTAAIVLPEKWFSFPVEQLAFDSLMGKAFPTRHYGSSDTRLLSSPSRIGRSFLGINTMERNKRISFSQYLVWECMKFYLHSSTCTFTPWCWSLETSELLNGSQLSYYSNCSIKNWKINYKTRHDLYVVNEFITHVSSPWRSFSYTGLGRPWRFHEAEVPRISTQSAYAGGKVIRPTHRPPLPPGDIPCSHLC